MMMVPRWPITDYTGVFLFGLFVGFVLGIWFTYAWAMMVFPAARAGIKRFVDPPPRAATCMTCPRLIPPEWSDDLLRDQGWADTDMGEWMCKVCWDAQPAWRRAALARHMHTPLQ